MLKLLGVRSLGGRDTAAVLRVLSRDPVAACMVAGRVEEYGLAGVPSAARCGAAAAPRPRCASPARTSFRCWAVRTTSSVRRARESRAATVFVHRRSRRVRAADVGAARIGVGRSPRGEGRTTPPRSRPRAARRTRPAGPSRAARRTRCLSAGRDLDVHRGGRHRPAHRRRRCGLPAPRREPHRGGTRLGAIRGRTGGVQGGGGLPVVHGGPDPGVWVDPAHRGSGLGTIGTAAVACAVARSGRLPSLYVNSFNAPARGAYARAGFRQVATFSTVLLD